MGESERGQYGGTNFYNSSWVRETEECTEKCMDDQRCHRVSHSRFGIGNLCMRYEYDSFTPTPGVTSTSWEKECPKGEDYSHIECHMHYMHYIIPEFLPLKTSFTRFYALYALYNT